MYENFSFSKYKIFKRKRSGVDVVESVQHFNSIFLCLKLLYIRLFGPRF